MTNLFRYIDTHAHVNLRAFDEDRKSVLLRLEEEGVAHINIGTQQRTSQKAVEIAEVYATAYAIVGLHPIQTVPGLHDEDEIGKGGTPFSSTGEVFDMDYYRSLAQSKKVVGIGECGFDYWHCPKESYEIQECAFIAQIELANELGLPLMIHTRGPKKGEESPTGRSVYLDVYEVLKQYAKVPFNVHFYAGTFEEAKKFFEIGGTISFTGVITFPPARAGANAYEEIIRNTPLELLHAETDCPFVAPVPYRGRRCEPWMVKEVYKKIAENKGLDEEVVREQLLANAKKLYKLK
jgi:TatD DNase family protein